METKMKWISSNIHSQKNDRKKVLLKKKSRSGRYDPGQIFEFVYKYNKGANKSN